MTRTPVTQKVDRLLAEAALAWSNGAWGLTGELATRTLELDASCALATAYRQAARAKARQTAQQLAQSLDCLPVLAFLTDRLNRIQWVNRKFGQTIGDPVREGLPPDERFLHAAIAGPYRNSFPRWKQELSNCLMELHREVEAGHLARETLRLIDKILCEQVDFRRAGENPVHWDGTMLVREPGGNRVLVREQVLPLLDAAGHTTGLHVTQWFPVEQPAEALNPREAPSVTELLTPRQLEIALLFASGLTAGEVATAAGISWRTARDHLEEVYSRLNVHSRSELTLQLARCNLV